MLIFKHHITYHDLTFSDNFKRIITTVVWTKSEEKTTQNLKLKGYYPLYILQIKRLETNMKNTGADPGF